MAVAVMVLAADTYRLMVLVPQEFKSLHGPNRLPPKKTAILRTSRDIRRLPTFTQTASGSDTSLAAVIDTIISIIRGNTDALVEDSVAAMFSGSVEETGSVSGLVVSTSALPPTTTTSPIAGSGIVTIS